MKLVVGLGNIGPEYRGTRHNFGWEAVERVASRLDAGSFREDRPLHALLTKGRCGSETVLLALPTTYMNRSGDAVDALLSFYQLIPKQLLIVQDELDLPLGSYRFSLGGSPAGHNGIRSIDSRLNTPYARLRLGIGRPTTPKPIEDYVLEPFNRGETTVALSVLNDAEAAIQDWIQDGLDAAQQTWNGKKG